MEWPNYTTKETLEDNDELMILDKDANANKRTLMDKIWNYVVDKMTTAVIAKLGTTNKTLIGAVNELNSNKMLCKAKRLDDNINDFFTENNKYQCEFLPVWGTIGGLFGGWAWGIVMVNNGSANFIGIANAKHTVAFAQYVSSTGWKTIK